MYAYHLLVFSPLYNFLLFFVLLFLLVLLLPLLRLLLLLRLRCVVCNFFFIFSKHCAVRTAGTQVYRIVFFFSRNQKKKKRKQKPSRQFSNQNNSRWYDSVVWNEFNFFIYLFFVFVAISIVSAIECIGKPIC